MSKIKNDHNILLRRSGLQPSQFLSTARQDGVTGKKMKGCSTNLHE